MKKEFIGRQEEIAILEGLLNTKEAEMLAVIGRRRVGKTYLVRTVYKDCIKFEISGIQNESRIKQLQNFSSEIGKITKIKSSHPIPKNWTDAFYTLAEILDKLKTKKKFVLFFDELPWLCSRRSGFLQAFNHFWNVWASKNNVVLVICGSAASWMTEKIIYDKGGLHNRITKLINLAPFTLAETKSFLESRHINLNHYQIIQIYMAMGGIPHYLKEIHAGLSAAQNINAICFGKNGLLCDEFSKLYPALFENADNHIKIIRALANKSKGLTRLEIVSKSNLPDGGSLNRLLTELLSS